MGLLEDVMIFDTLGKNGKLKKNFYEIIESVLH